MPNKNPETISITAQNEYFAALDEMFKTVCNPNGKFYMGMITELNRLNAKMIKELKENQAKLALILLNQPPEAEATLGSKGHQQKMLFYDIRYRFNTIQSFKDLYRRRLFNSQYNRFLDDISLTPWIDMKDTPPVKELRQEALPETIENTIESFMAPFEGNFNSKEDYLKAIQLLNNYFAGGEHFIGTPLFVKGKVLRKLAFALGETWRSKTNRILTYEYLQFLKQLFSIFENQTLSKKVNGSNFYKYLITTT